MSDIVRLLDRQPCSPEYDNFVDELDAAGYIIVPKKPTDEMIAAGWIDKEDVNPDDIYRSMIDVAPKFTS